MKQQKTVIFEFDFLQFYNVNENVRIIFEN